MAEPAPGEYRCRARVGVTPDAEIGEDGEVRGAVQVLNKLSSSRSPAAAPTAARRRRISERPTTGKGCYFLDCG